MGNREKLLTLDEVLQHVLESEDEYNEPDSTDESSEEEYEPCKELQCCLWMKKIWRLSDLKLW